jgi:ABC-type multidrug transport system ATPase subunit
MEVFLEKVSKQFDSRYIFRSLNLHIPSKTFFGFRGLNGSGKSTLVNIIAGYITPSEGDIHYTYQGQKIDYRNHLHNYLASSGPDLYLPQDLTLNSIFQLFKKSKFNQQFEEQEFWHFLELDKHNYKKFQELSSGMQQRFKLGLTMFSRAEMYIFDEPGNFLDQYWSDKVMNKMHELLHEKLVIIASNSEADFQFCTQFYRMDDFN